jgi:uncharacterized protein (TIGR02265 family)
VSKQGVVIELVGAHCDLEERLRVVPPSAHVRGLYLRSVAAVVERAGKAEEYAGLVGDDRYSPVRLYPVGDYLVHLAAGVAVLYGPERVHEGMKEISRRNAQAIADSLLGRTLLRVLSPQPERLLRQAVAGHRLSADYGSWELSFPEPRHARIEFREEYAWIESSLVGAAIGTYEVVGITPEVRCELTGRFAGTHYLSW